MQHAGQGRQGVFQDVTPNSRVQVSGSGRHDVIRNESWGTDALLQECSGS
jgi:hypothetical protein